MILKPLVLLLAGVAASAALCDLRVEPDENHVVTSRLAGTWEPVTELCERLGRRPPFERLEFTADPSVLDSIPESLAEAFAEQRIWQAGTLTARASGERKQWPYLVLDLDGNNHVVLLRATGSGGLDDAESALVSLAPAKKTENDLLFMGSDFNNEPFAAYGRVVDR